MKGIRNHQTLLIMLGLRTVYIIDDFFWRTFQPIPNLQGAIFDSIWIIWKADHLLADSEAQLVSEGRVQMGFQFRLRKLHCHSRFFSQVRIWRLLNELIGKYFCHQDCV